MKPLKDELKIALMDCGAFLFGVSALCCLVLVLASCFY